MTRRLISGVCTCLALCSAAPAGAQDEAPPAGEIYLSHQHDDGHADRFDSSLGWVGPAGPLGHWLQLEAGGRYWEFDEAHSGHAILGARAELPTGTDTLYGRTELGAGDGVDGSFNHLTGIVGWEHRFLRELLALDAELRWFRVGAVRENLVKVGAGVAPRRWLRLKGDYRRSVFGGEGTRAWSGSTVFRWGRGRAITLGYTRSEDTVEPVEIALDRVRGVTTHKYRVRLTLPIGASRSVRGGGAFPVARRHAPHRGLPLPLLRARLARHLRAPPAVAGQGGRWNRPTRREP